MFSMQPTAYDLRFRMFSIPIRVMPTFFLLAALLGFEYLRDAPGIFVVWIAVVFVSILVHELGHALTARAFGYPPSIVMYHFGGLAFYHPDSQYTPWRATLITLAGPMAGFALYGLAYFWNRNGLFWMVDKMQIVPPFYLIVGWSLLEKVNFFWSVFNLLPVLPLDGGRLCESISAQLGARDPLKIAAWFSVIVGGAVALWFIQQDMFYNGIMFGMLAAQSFPLLQRR